MPEQYSVEDAFQAMDHAKRWVARARFEPNYFTDAEFYLNKAENILINTQTEYGNLEEKHDLQQAADFLQTLQATYQSIQHKL
ncbi:hypothetical protein [Aquibacillus albus]|uniref:HEPN domain-containing protein n=1 Tax=Aquibacillus albus TaxID=1168171 RepID=A0ABS2MZB0_9BACI|nr:hypothetical protein [Aquibacillus albus]MBM7571171.1 hypothetical protein [Aquibacillus albus]